MTTTNKKLLWILACALILRLCFWSIVLKHPERSLYGDTKGYQDIAVSFLNGNFLTPVPSAGVVRPPLFPTFIAINYLLLGEKLEMITLIQNFIDIISILLIFLIGKTLSGDSTGLISASLYAVDPIPLIFNQYIMSETLFIFLFLLGLFGIVRYIRLKSFPWLIIASLIWGLAANVRSIGALLLMILQIFVLFSMPRKEWKKTLVMSAATCALFLMTLVPWTLRNYKVYHTSFFSTNDELAFIVAHATKFLSVTENKTTEESMQTITKQAWINHPEILSKKDEFGLSHLKDIENEWYLNWGTNPYTTNILFRESLKTVLSHPRLYFINVMKNASRLALFPCSQRNEAISHLLGLQEIPVNSIRNEIRNLTAQGKYWKAIVYFLEMRISPLSPFGQMLWIWILLFEAAVFIGALFTIYIVLHPHKPYFLKLFCFCMLLSVFYFFSAAGLESEPRYRFPVESILCIMAGLFITNLDHFFSMKNESRQNIGE